MKKYLAIALIIVGLMLIAVACAAEPVEVEVIKEVEVPVEVEVIKEVEVPVEVEVVKEVLPFAIPFAEAWAASGHADATAEAFRHWDGDDPAEVPANCAKCHSEGGYLDFLGEDGSEFGSVEANHAIDSTVSCVTCHNKTTLSLTSVVMPSGIELTGLGDEARCMQCHQGRSSALTVASAIEAAGVGDDDVSENLGFINIHYYAAAATKYGTLAKGGYEYAGKTYDANFQHVEGFESCIDCHSPHTLEVKVASCTGCHADVEAAEDFMDVRMAGSLVDYDGDGSMSEGVYYEIEGLQALLYAAIQAYGSEVAGAAIIYDSHAYPYFFIDTDGDGQSTEGEANYGNQYASWTPRLLKAVYNYQVSKKDTGAYAHGGKYIIALLYDSIEDLNKALATPVDLSAANRIDRGHFAGSEEAFRHWDEDGEVSGSCTKCHTAEGLPFLAKNGVNIAMEPSNGLQCSTCHDNVGEYTLYTFDSVTFPSGKKVDSEMADANSLVCMNCHQGRSWKGSVDSGLTGVEDADAVIDGLGFVNIHYFPAGATRYGTEVQGAYEFDGNEYVGYFEHIGNIQGCTDCHSAHQLEVKAETCFGCHEAETLQDIRVSETDFDGDGDAEEGLYGEIVTMKEALYAAMQAYALQAGVPIVYDSHAYPYFFVDTDGNGESNDGEANYGNKYNAFSANSVAAAYNFQLASKDPGGFAHNGLYMIQVLYDSIVAVGGDVSGMTRP